MPRGIPKNPKVPKAPVDGDGGDRPLAGDFATLTEDQLPVDVMQVLEELGENVSKIVLSRRTQGDKQAYLTTFDADEFSLDLVARTYGGGRYIARFKAAGGAYVQGITFVIDESIKADPKPVPAALAGAGGGGDRDLLLKLIEKMGDTSARKDPMEIAAAIAATSSANSQATMTAMMAAMAPLLAKITELASGGGGGKSTPISDLMQAIQLGADLGGDGSDSYLPIIKEVGVPLVQAIEKTLAARTGAAPAALLPKPSSSEGPPMTAAAGLPAWTQAVAPFIPKLVEYATQGVEPITIAGIIDASYPRLARWLENAVENPAFEGQLLAYFPALAPHAAWVHGLCGEFLPDEPEPGDGDAEAVSDDGE